MIQRSGYLSRFTRTLWLTVVFFVMFAITFFLYLRAERQTEHAYELRHHSFVLADELRQSSDDLTRMVRTYVATGDPIYKRHYQEILNIRDGRMPRPVRYEDIYWDLVLDDDRRPAPDGEAISLLERMRLAGFTTTELAVLAMAKANSDALTKPEFAAMALIEPPHPATATNRLKAMRMLTDTAYHLAKAGIMKPISEFYKMLDERTLKAIRDAERFATLLRLALIMLGAALAFLLWSAYRVLYATLGCSVDELQERISRLGKGELSLPIPVARGMEDSVLAWLSGTQRSLARLDAERRAAEVEVRQLNAVLEQRVAQRTEQLEAAGRELEEFSYSISHSMRIPLRALDGFSKILLDEYGTTLDDEGKRLLNVVRDNAQRMGRLVDDILHYLSLGRRPLEQAPIDMDGLVRGLCAEIQAATPERSLHFSIGELPPSRGDWVMIRETWRNLLSNAVKFSWESDSVLVEIGGAAGNEENVYCVKDHGVGFDMRYADKLFRVFERVHPTGQYEGSGMGLAVVKRIVTRHGGRVWAEGKVNEGAAIYFALPNKGENHG